MSPEEEAETARRIRKHGSREERDRLVLANQRFLVSQAKLFQNMGLPLTDLINEGEKGLIEAAELFDESRGFKFISYAVWKIGKHIREALAEYGKQVRLPRNKQQLIYRARRAMERHLAEYGTNPDLWDLAEELGVEPESLEEAIRADKLYLRIDLPVMNGEENTYADLYLHEEDERWHSLEDMRIVLEHELGKLDEREADIIRWHYGLQGREAHSIPQIAQHYNLTPERVRQLHQKAFNELKERMPKKYMELIPNY